MILYSVIWSPTAKLSYLQILEYLEDKWTIKEIAFFMDRTEEVLDHICRNPLIYPYSKGKDIHRSIIIKQISLFYRIKAKEVELLTFWDNRQEPDKLKL